MPQNFESNIESWNKHVEELVKVSAKKADAVEAKHRQIVDGACRVFFKKGFHPTSIREIAEAANMSPGQVYHYISSKDDVLFLIHKHMQTSWYQRLIDWNIRDIEEPRRKLAAALRVSFDFLVGNKELIQFIYTESKYLSKKHLRVVLEMDKNHVVGFWRELLVDILGEGKSEVDIDLAANFITYAMVIYPLRGWNIKITSLDELFSFLLNFIFNGIGLGAPEDTKI